MALPIITKPPLVFIILYPVVITPYLYNYHIPLNIITFNYYQESNVVIIRKKGNFW